MDFNLEEFLIEEELNFDKHLSLNNNGKINIDKKENNLENYHGVGYSDTVDFDKDNSNIETESNPETDEEIQSKRKRKCRRNTQNKKRRNKRKTKKTIENRKIIRSNAIIP